MERRTSNEGMLMDNSASSRPVSSFEAAAVLSAWLQNMRAMAGDLDEHRSDARARVLLADSRAVGDVLEPASVDAVITSPPYPNEKDYTRTVRLESVILGFIRSKQELRTLKQRLVRSNTRGVYKADTDDLEVATHAAIGEIRKRSSGGGWSSARPPASSASTLASPSCTSAACVATWPPCGRP